MYSALFHLQFHGEVPLSKAPNLQLLPGRRSINGLPIAPGVCSRCVFTDVCVCTWMGKCRVRILSMGHHTWLYVTFTFNTLHGSKLLFFSFMPKIIRILSKDHVPLRYFVNFSTVNIPKPFLISNVHCWELNLDNFKDDFFFSILN